MAAPIPARGQPLSHKHPPYLRLLRSQRQTDADLPPLLRHRVCNHPVDPDHAEHQRHRACNSQHHERKGCSRERPVVDFLHGLHRCDRQALIYRPHRLTYLIEKGLTARPVAANGECDCADGGRAPRCVVLVTPVRGPVDNLRSRLLHAIVMDVGRPGKRSINDPSS
jgi:hypothetical protein